MTKLLETGFDRFFLVHSVYSNKAIEVTGIFFSSPQRMGCFQIMMFGVTVCCWCHGENCSQAYILPVETY